MPPRILLATILRAQGANGVITATNSLLHSFKKAGYDAELLTPFDASPLIFFPLFAVRSLVRPVSKNTGVWWHRHFHAVVLRSVLAEKLKDGRETIIFAQCPVSAKAAMDVLDPSRHVLALAVHFNHSQAEEWRDQGLIRENDWAWKSCKRLDEEVFPAVDRFLYVSDYSRRHIEAQYPDLAKKPAMTGIDYVSSQGNARRDLSRATRDLVSVGSLEPRKNQIFLLRVLRAARDLGHEPTLTIVGCGPDLRQLQREAERLGIAGQVHFFGESSDVFPCLARHKVYVHAATMESFGFSLIEAMSIGMPVVAAPVGGIPEVFTDGVEGRYWPLDDAETAARILVDILQDDARLEYMGLAAKQRFLKCFEESIVFPRVADFLLEGCTVEHQTEI